MSIFENAFMILLSLPTSTQAGCLARADGLLRCSDGAVGQRCLHGGAGLEGAEDLHGCDGGAGEFRRDIAGDASKAENLEVELCPRIRGPPQDPVACSATAQV
jgi:hypothetical protein